MVTLSVTPSRVGAVLRGVADLLEVEGWDPHINPLVTAIDRAAGYVPGKGTKDAEEATIQAWDALAAHLGCESVSEWEAAAGRTEVQVLHAARSAAQEVSS